MAQSSNLQFSVLLEAATAAFNANIKQAGSEYKTTTDQMRKDSADTTASAEKTSDSFKKIFQITDARVVGEVLRGATRDLNAMTEGAILSSQELKNIGNAAKASIGTLRADLIKAKADFTELFNSKAPTSAIEIARGKVQQLTADVANSRVIYIEFQAAAASAMARVGTATGAAGLQARQLGGALYNALNIAGPTGLATAQVNALGNSLASTARQAVAVTTNANAATFSVQNLVKGLLLASGVQAGLQGVAQGLRLIIDTALEFERVGKSLSYATGSAVAAGKAFEFVRDTSKSLGLDLLASAAGFGQLASATKGTALEGQATRDVFIGVSSASAAMGLSVDNTKSVFLALTQIASKGVVQMEELRGQLGERLPPVMAIAAKSLGTTTEHLNELVKQGLDATVFLKAFGPAMIQAFKNDAEKNAESLQGRINLLRNEFKEAINDFAKAGASKGLSQVFDDLKGAIESARKEGGGLKSEFNAIGDILTALYSTGKETFTVLTTAVNTVSLAINDAISILTIFNKELGTTKTKVEEVSFTTRVFQGISIIIGAIKDGIYALGIAFTQFGATVDAFFSRLALTASKFTFGDLSKQFQQLSFELRDKATEGFNAVDTKIANFKSAITEAADKAVEESIRIEQGLKTGVAAPLIDAAKAATGLETAGTSAGAALVAASSNARSTLEFVGAEAVISAGKLDKLGTGGSQAIGAIDAALVKVKDTIRVFAGEGGEAVVNFVKETDRAKVAIQKLAKDLGISLPPAATKLDDLALSIAAVAVRSESTARALGEDLPKAVANLNAADLTKFKDALISGLLQAGATSEVTVKALNTLDTAILKTFGADFSAALNKTSDGFDKLLIGLKTITDNTQNYAAQGINANLLVRASLEGLLTKAANPFELQILADKWKEFGKTSDEANRLAEKGLIDVHKRIDETKPGINSVAEAFRTFGLQTREEAKLTAKTYLDAYELMKSSGVATAEELRVAFKKLQTEMLAINGGIAETAAQAFQKMGAATRQELQETANQNQRSFLLIQGSGQATKEVLIRAFTTYAESAVAANNGVIGSFLELEAINLGVKISVDATGKATVHALSDVEQKLDNINLSYEQVQDAAKNAGKVQVEAANEATAALDKQAAAAERAASAGQRAAASGGGSKGGMGDRGVGGSGSYGRGGVSGDGFAGDPTPSELYSAVKGMGGSDGLASRMQSQVKQYYNEVYLGQGMVRFFSWDKFEKAAANEINREKESVRQGGPSDPGGQGISSGGTYSKPTDPQKYYTPDPRNPVKKPGAGYFGNPDIRNPLKPKPEELNYGITYLPVPPPPVNPKLGATSSNDSGTNKRTIRLQLVSADGKTITGQFPESAEEELLRILGRAKGLV